MVEQAVVLAAGKGTRLQRPDPNVPLEPEVETIARQGYKALIPICGRRFFDYAIDRLIEAGIRRICLILAPNAGPMMEYVQGLPQRFPGLHAEHVIQPEPLGTAHAVRFAQPATGDREFLLLNSDDLYPVSSLRSMAEAPSGISYCIGFEREALITHSNFEASRVPALGILVPSKEDPDRLEQVIEKPQDPEAYRRDGKLWITMNLWRFTPKVYEDCARAQKSTRGEYEIPETVGAMAAAGERVGFLRCYDGVLDLTSRGDILHLESVLCQKNP